MELLIPRSNGESHQDSCLGDGEVKGGQGEDGSSVGEAHEVGQGDGDGEELEKSGFREGEQ